jgi:hypothetical protein
VFLYPIIKGTAMLLPGDRCPFIFQWTDLLCSKQEVAYLPILSYTKLHRSYCARCGSRLLPGIWGKCGQLEEGGEGGPGTPGGGRDKQSVLNEGRDNLAKDVEDQPRWTWWGKIGAKRVGGVLNKLNFVITIAELIWHCFSFKRINRMAFKNHLHWSSVYLPLDIKSWTLTLRCLSYILPFKEL